MNADQHRVELARTHRRWCNRFAVYSIGVILAEFIAAVLIMDRLRVPAAERSGVYVMLATIVLAVIIWNAAGIAVTEIHALLEGQNLS